MRIKYVNAIFMIAIFIETLALTSCVEKPEKLEEVESVDFKIINASDKFVKIVRFGNEYTNDTAILMTGNEIIQNIQGTSGTILIKPFQDLDSMNIIYDDIIINYYHPYFTWGKSPFDLAYYEGGIKRTSNGIIYSEYVYEIKTEDFKR